MEMQLFLRMILRSWWIVALAALTALSISLTASYFATPLYRTSAQLLVSPNASLSGTQAVYGLDTLSKRSIVSTYAEVLNSGRIFNETGVALQIPPDELEAYTLLTVVLPEANVLDLSVTGPDPQVAALLANGVGQRAIDYIKGLYQAYDINFLELAPVPTTPVSPKPVQDATLAAGLGLILGLGLAALRAYLPVAAGALHRRTETNGLATPPQSHRGFPSRRAEPEALPVPRLVDRVAPGKRRRYIPPPSFAVEITEPHPVMNSAVFEIPLPGDEPTEATEAARWHQTNSLAASLMDWYRQVRRNAVGEHYTALAFEDR